MNRENLTELVQLARANGLNGIYWMGRALDQWDNNPKDSASTAVAQLYYAMVEVNVLAGMAPGLLGYGSEDEFVLGYKPTETGRAALSDIAAKEFKEWSWIRTTAHQLIDQPARPDSEDLRTQQTELFERLSDFIAKRKRIRDNAMWVREERSRGH